MERSAVIPFRVGEKIRLRAGGIGGDGIVGRVKSISNGKMIIEWGTGGYKGRTSTYDLNDTAKFTAALEKVL